MKVNHERCLTKPSKVAGKGSKTEMEVNDICPPSQACNSCQVDRTRREACFLGHVESKIGGVIPGFRFELDDRAPPPRLGEATGEIPADSGGVPELQADPGHSVRLREWTSAYFVISDRLIHTRWDFLLTFTYGPEPMSRHARDAKHVRATMFLLPAYFAPTSRLRVAFHRLRGVDIGDSVEIGYEVLIDNLYPEKVHIGNHATVSARSTILAHDEAKAYARDEAEVIADTYVGEKAFIGVASVVLPGIRVGPRAIVGAGSVVTGDVAAGAIVVGVPARELQKK